MGSNDIMPFWHYNVPEEDRTDECPEYLLGLSEKDLGIISTLDADYHYQTWDEVCKLAQTNRLELFQRLPSALRRYRAFTWNLARTYGSVGHFILNRRLGWNAPVRPRGAPFQYEDDFKILYNDWPYGIDPKIVHLVVWTKFELHEDPATGDLTDHARREIDDFVTRTFRSRVPPEHVIWFKNWSALKSVHTVEHFHVMMLDPDLDFVREITKYDIPQCELAR